MGAVVKSAKLPARSKSPAAAALPVRKGSRGAQGHTLPAAERAVSHLENSLTPVWPDVPLWSKWVCTSVCFFVHLWVIYQSPDPLTDPWVLLVSLSVALNSVFLFAFGLPLLLVDLYPHRFLSVSKHKIQPELNVPLPPKLLSPLLAVSALNSVVTGTATLVFMYVCVTLPLEYFFLAPGQRWMTLDMREMPTLLQALQQLLVIILAEEVLFYHTHRVLHKPFFYRRFHKSHHEWTAPVGISAIYCHPLEHVLSNAGPIMLATLAARAHVIVFYGFSLVAVVNTTLVHAGYHLPFLYPSPEHHDYHHQKSNGNYGVTGLCDYLYGSDASFLSSGRSQLHGVTLTFKPLPRTQNRTMTPLEHSSYFGWRALVPGQDQHVKET